MESPPRRRSLVTTLIAFTVIATTLLVLAAVISTGAEHRRSPTSVATNGPMPSADSGVTSNPRPAPIVYRPPGLSRAGKVPLVVALYSDTGCPQCMEGLTKFEHVAAEHGFVVAYPGSTTQPPWNGPDDLSYLSSFIDQVKASENVDPLRVYVTGFSAGGRMAYQVGCALSSKVAAVAIVSSVMRSYACNLTHPVSELTLDGGNESTALNGNSSGIPPASATAAKWRRLDGCPAQTPLQTSSVGPVTQQTWGSCVDGSAVALYVLAGGHHTWPGSYGLSRSDPDSQYNASEEIWSFLAAHPAGSLTRPSASLLGIKTATKRRLIATLKLAERVTVKETLIAHNHTLASKNSSLSAGGHLALILIIPRKVGRGRYQVKLLIQDAYNRVLTIVRKIRVS